MRCPAIPAIIHTLVLATALAGTQSRSAGAEGEDAQGDIFNMVGTWQGVNRTISDKKGLREWDKTIHITEQTDRRFRGHFTYSAGTKRFFGVIYPGDESFTWVASDSKGYNHGRILDDDRITACYVEPGEEATAGCSDLRRISPTPESAPAPAAKDGPGER
jgi:hypothetical protein